MTLNAKWQELENSPFLSLVVLESLAGVQMMQERWTQLDYGSPSRRWREIKHKPGAFPKSNVKRHDIFDYNLHWHQNAPIEKAKISSDTWASKGAHGRVSHSKARPIMLACSSVHSPRPPLVQLSLSSIQNKLRIICSNKLILGWVRDCDLDLVDNGNEIYYSSTFIPITEQIPST